MFNLWNLSVTIAGCEFDVTQANVFSPGNGSRAWIQRCLAAWALTGDPIDWEISPVRSTYFSDYLDSENWRDRWPKVWMIRVRGRFSTPQRVDPPYEIRKYVEEPDPTGSNEPVQDSAQLTPALIIGGVRAFSPEIETVTIPRLIDIASTHGFNREQLKWSVREAVPSRPIDSATRSFVESMGPATQRTLERLERKQLPLFQVRTLIAHVSFPTDEKALSELLGDLKASGFLVHRHALESDALG